MSFETRDKIQFLFFIRNYLQRKHPHFINSLVIPISIL